MLGFELLALVLGPKETGGPVGALETAAASKLGGGPSKCIPVVGVVVGGNESGGRVGMSAKTAGWRLGGGATVGARAGGGV